MTPAISIYAIGGNCDPRLNRYRRGSDLLLRQSRATSCQSITRFSFTMTTQSQSLRLADLLVAQPYTSIGSYPKFAITRDSAAICKKCAHSERELIGTTTGTDGWCIDAIDVNWEDPQLCCDHCGELIESAYGEA